MVDSGGAEIIIDESGMLGKQRLDFQTVLVWHLNRISYLSAFIPKVVELQPTEFKVIMPEAMIRYQREVQIDSMMFAIDCLEGMLIPYMDETCENELKELDKQCKKEVGTRLIVRDRLKSLMRLMARRNLLLEEKMMAAMSPAKSKKKELKESGAMSAPTMPATTEGEVPATDQPASQT